VIQVCATHPYRNGHPGSFRVEKCEHQHVVVLASLSSKDRVNLLRPTRNTQWFRCVDVASGETIGAGGLLFLDDGSARIKGLFVHPSWRHRGVADHLNDERIAEATRRGCRVIEGFTNATRWTRRGFERVGQRHNGIGIWRLIIRD